MGYAFEVERQPGPSIGYNNWQMGFLREIMREVGAVDDPGARQALRWPGMAPTAESASMDKFTSNADWHVTPPEARFIAARLRAGAREGVPQELMGFYDDAPADVLDWVHEFADFNERAADQGGYRVR